MDTDRLRLQLIETICRLPDETLPQAVAALQRLALAISPAVAGEQSPTQRPRDWPHAPIHRLTENGTYMVTTGTYGKKHLFCDPERLTLLEDALLAVARKYEWNLEAWSVFSNHYHFVGYTLASPTRLKDFLNELHSSTARDVNRLDRIEERQVWHNYWDKQLTYEKSYLARLNYVHQNPVKHDLVAVANQYPWCSAAWFERTATPAQVKTIYGVKTDAVNVLDDFDPLHI